MKFNTKAPALAEAILWGLWPIFDRTVTSCLRVQRTHEPEPLVYYNVEGGSDGWDATRRG